MAVMGKPKGLKLRAFIDDALSAVTGKRIFTSIITDSALRKAIERDRKARLRSGKKATSADMSESSLAEAASVYRALNRKAP